ncbi:sugar kinase [bacterium]|nr:sugar kinase [bacterium]
MDTKLDIVAIGETLVEFSTDLKLSKAECLNKYYGGDCLAASISALRLGSKVGFITKLGNDAFKDYLLENWQNEGLDISQIKFANEQNGLYVIARPTLEEKEIVYYRKKTAPSKLTIDDISVDYIKNAEVLYSSGITKSLSASAAESVDYAFKIAKDNGVITAYDPNFCSAIMTGDDARQNFENIIQYVDIFFVNTKCDTINVLEMDSVENIIKALWDRGVSTVVIKAEDKGGYYTGCNGNIVFTEFYTKNIVDTTSAGDAFNGAFLHGITNGMSAFDASKLASISAGLQAEGIGAIKSIPYKDQVYSIFKEGY